MFEANKIKTLAKSLNLTNELTIELINRQAKYLKVSSRALLNSYVVLNDIQLKQAKQKEEEIQYISSNLIIQKYSKLIKKLYEIDQMGYVKISQYLKLNHNAKVSKSTIANFINKNDFNKFKNI